MKNFKVPLTKGTKNHEMRRLKSMLKNTKNPGERNQKGPAKWREILYSWVGSSIRSTSSVQYQSKS